jgi:predicted lipid carrier protein YhbT
MQNYHIPSPLTRAAMSALPAPLLQRMIDILISSMRRSHPRLFKNLERLDGACVRFEPSDVPHRFVLSFGQGETSLSVTGEEDSACDARIKGKLEALLAMLEGRVDGDKLFFSREIEITGDTSVVVALRNTLDREEIDLVDDIVSLFGPFAPPARAIMVFAAAFTQRVKGRPGEEAVPCECAALRAEVLQLKTRLAKLEGRPGRQRASAS